ncbi:hypothetical protein EsH8_I_000254 [Colletotrichum jinshuiense]
MDYLASPDCQKVAFADIWYLFKPGDFVIGDNDRQIYRVMSVASTGHRASMPYYDYFNTSGRSPDALETSIRILCIHIDFDGSHLGPITTEFSIKKFQGVKALTALEIRPCNFDRDPSQREKYINRGKKFVRAIAIQHLHYAGIALETRDEIDSQVVIDFAECLSPSASESWKPWIDSAVGVGVVPPAFESCEEACCRSDCVYHDEYIEEMRDKAFMSSLLPPKWTHSKLPSIAVYPRTLDEANTEENNIAEEEFLIMSYRVFGFVLNSRKWGDLGTTAKEVELALERNFSLASKWGCILLVDEADVFLARRTTSDFARNGMVAVFLRVLEYYAGILFLTTNRVGDFDEAFTSRIHISLHYPPLDRDSTDAVFEVNLNRIKKHFKTNGRKIEIEDFKVRSMAERYWRENPKARWNGRQIRNACQTALALSEFEVQGGMSVFETTKSSYNATKNTNVDVTVKLGVKHFETVQLAYLSFIKYLDDVYGADADTRAKDGFLRASYRDVANMRADATNPSHWPGNSIRNRSNSIIIHSSHNSHNISNTFSTKIQTRMPIAGHGAG